MQAALADRVYALPDVENRPTTLSAEGARAIWLRDGVPVPTASVQPFLGNREIGHFHPWDGSLHIALPPDVANEAVEAGWAAGDVGCADIAGGGRSTGREPGCSRLQRDDTAERRSTHQAGGAD